MQQPSAQTSVDARHRVLLILWAVFLISIVLYIAVAYFVGPTARDVDGSGGNNFVLLLVFMLLGVFMVALSFIMKNSFLAQAASQRRPDLAQIAYIIAFALSEAAGIFGLVTLLVTGNSYGYLLFVIGAVSLLLHMPRRNHLLAAATNSRS